MTTAHLSLMSKPRLIRIIEATETRAQQHANLAAHWRGLLTGVLDTAPQPTYDPACVETTTAEAARILRSLPVDPMAEEHRDVLRAAINTGGRQPLAGARCTYLSRSGVCGRLLNDYGFCSAHERAATNRAKARAAA